MTPLILGSAFIFPCSWLLLLKKKSKKQKNPVLLTGFFSYGREPEVCARYSAYYQPFIAFDLAIMRASISKTLGANGAISVM
jgi:hypothetical protein